MVGVYSASGRTEIGLTYRLDDRGGVKFETQSGFGGELLLSYRGYTQEDYIETYLDFQPSLLYRFKGSSDTSPYVGIGYFFSKDTFEDWGIETEVWQQWGFALLVGMEHFFGEKLSVDLRATAYFSTWKDTFWDSPEDRGTRNGLYLDMGVSMYP